MSEAQTSEAQNTELQGNLSTQEMSELFFDDLPTKGSIPKTAPTTKAGYENLKKEESESKEEESEEIVEDAEEESDSEDKSEEKKAVKKIKVGDEEIELALDAVVPHRVDGKDVEVTVEDLLSNYAGKVAWDEKFQKLAQEKKVFSQDKQAIQSLVSRFYEKANAKDPLGAIAVVAEASGIDPAHFLKDFRSNIFKMIHEHGKKDPNELRMLEYEENEKTYTQIQKERAERQKKEQEQARINADLEKVLDTTGASREELATIYKELTQQGNTNLTPQQLGQEYQARKRESLVVGTLHSVDPNLDNETFKKVGTYLYNQAQLNPDFTEADLKEIAEKLLDGGKQQDKTLKKKRLGEKLKKSAPERVAKPEVSKAKASEPMFFDDL